MEFIDIINLGNGKYIKRYWKDASGKKEIIELECSMSAYSDYLEKRAIADSRKSDSPDERYVYDVIHNQQRDIDAFNFNQRSNFLYHFVNKFTDTEIPIEAIREELKKML